MASWRQSNGWRRFRASHSVTLQNRGVVYQPPHPLRVWHEGRLVPPFVHPLVVERDPITFRRGYVEDRSQRLPLLLALATIIPAAWPSTWVYLGIVAVLALIGWAGLARVVRGQVLAAREIEYVRAAQALGARDLRVVLRHLLPNLSSYLVIAATLALPGYILGESALSFLGLGIKEPMTSWGLLLADAQSFEALSLYPWLLTPGALIVLSVLAFNFVGDALRDALDVRSR